MHELWQLKPGIFLQQGCPRSRLESLWTSTRVIAYDSCGRGENTELIRFSAEQRQIKSYSDPFLH